MSEQENTPPHALRGAKALTHLSSDLFTSSAAESWTASCATHARQKTSVLSQLQQNTPLQQQLDQYSLPADGICINLKDEVTSCEYGVRRAPNGVYDLVLQSTPVGERPKCRFMLLHKGEYIGIRCADAKGRYLQARKQGLQRLVFYSDHCGTWEQWKVVAWRQHCAGGEGVIKLSSRRLPGFTWSARIIPADLSACGRPNSGGNATDADDAHAEEGVLDLSMRLTAGFVHRLHLGPMPAIFATWRQLAVQAKKRLGQLRKCEDRWHRRWLQEGFARWRAGAAALRRRRCLAQRASARHAGRCLRAAMSAWLQHTLHRRSLHRAEAGLRSAHMRRQLSSAFGAWRQHVEAEHQLTAVCMRITAWRVHRRLRALFNGWATLTQQEHHGRLADMGLLEALENCQKEAEDVPSAALTFPLQSRQRKSLSRLVALKQQQHHAGTPARQQDSISAHSAAMKPGSTDCADSNNSQDGREALPEEWHAALEMQPADASPALQLSGCWTEARPGMPSAVTRSQLRAPAWRPAGGTAPGRLDSCAPVNSLTAAPRAASLQPQGSHCDRGSSDAEHGRAHVASSVCLEAGMSTSPQPRMPELATAGHAGLPSSRASSEREQTPFFTPGAALPGPEPPSPLVSRPVVSSRLMTASVCHGSLLHDGKPVAMADEQGNAKAVCQDFSDSNLVSEETIGSSPCGSGSADVSSSKEGSSSHQELRESPSGQDSTGSPDSGRTTPCTALSQDDGPAHSSSTGSWATDMAEWGSPGSCPMLSDVSWPSVSDDSELQQTPAARQRPEEPVQSASSSVGECVTPGIEGHDFLLNLHGCDRGRARALLQDTECLSQAATQEEGIPPEEGQAEASHASCCGLQSPDGDSMQSPAPAQQPLPPSLANTAQSCSEGHASAPHLLPASLRGSSSHDEGLAGPSSGRGGSASARAGNRVSSSRFWEAPAGARPGQATQSPLPCRPGTQTVAGSAAARQAYLQAHGRQLVSGAEGDQPRADRSVAHDIAAGRSTCFAAWAAADPISAEDSLSPFQTSESAVLLGSSQQACSGPAEPASLWSVGRNTAAGSSTSPAARASAEGALAEHRLSPPASPGLALLPAWCSADRWTQGQPAAPRSPGYTTPAGRSSGITAQAAAETATVDSMGPLGTPEHRASSASCMEDQPAAGSQERQFGAWQQAEVPAQEGPDGSPLSASVPQAQRACSDRQLGRWQLGNDLTPEQPEGSKVSASLPQASVACSDGTRAPAAPDSMTAAAPSPVRAAAAAVPPGAEGSASGCEAPRMALAAVPASQADGGAQGVRPGQQGLTMQSPSGARLDSPGSRDSMPSPLSAHHTQSMAARCDSHFSAASGLPVRQSHGVRGSNQGAYSSLQAARQVFGEASACHSPALSLRGWDGSIRTPFTAWQHATVLLWQGRLQTAAPLIRRRRFRMLAWPFRAWAAQSDHWRHAASSPVKPAEHSPPTAIVQARREHEERSALHDSFWHWQEETVWGWKQRRDALATASAARLRRMLHAWRSLAAADEDAAVLAFRAAAVSARQISTLQAWCATAGAQAAAATDFQSVSRARRSTAVIRAWLETALSSAANRAAVQEFSGQRRIATLAAALGHWQLFAKRSQRAAALLESVHRRLAKRALLAWRHAAQCSRQLKAASQLLRYAAARVRAARALMAWRSMLSMSHALSAFQHEKAANLVKNALHAWRDHAVHARQLRSAAASLTALDTARLMRQGLQALQEHANSCGNARARADRHAALCSRRMLDNCLASWQAQAAAARYCAEAAEHLCAQNLLRSLFAAWQQWRVAVQIAAAQAEAAERYATERQVQLQYAIVHAWRKNTELTVHRTATALLHCLDRKAWTMQQQVMEEWQVLVQHYRAARAQAEASQHATDTDIQSLVLWSWRQAASTASEARAGAEAIVQLSSMQRTARTVLTAWHGGSARAGSARHRAGQMAQEHQIRLLRQSLHCWQNSSRLLQVARQAALEAHKAYHSAQTLQQCLCAWRAHHMQLQAVRAAAEAYGQGRESAAMRSAVTGWRQVTTAEHMKRQHHVQSFQVAYQRRLLSSVLTHWQALQRSIWAALAKAEMRHKALQAGTLRAAFLMWRLVSASMVDSQHLSCQSVSRAFALRKLRAVLRAWAAMCRAAKAAQQAAESLADRAHLRSVQRTFSAWRIANASLQHQRSMLLSLCIELAHERRLSAAFTAWHGCARSRQRAVIEARGLEARCVRKALRQAFAAWRIANAVLAHQQRSTAERMLAARAQRTQRVGFLAWRQRMAHMRTVRTTAAVRGLASRQSSQMVHLGWTFQFWRQYARACADRELAEASLTRNILLARAFHFWAAVAHGSQLLEPSQCSDSKRRSAALAESIHALKLQRSANWEELRSSADVLDQSTRLQDELRELQDRLHTLHVSAWQCMLPAPLGQQTT